MYAGLGLNDGLGEPKRARVLEELLARGKYGDMTDAAEWAERWLGFTPDAMQAQVLHSSSKRGILNCTRQWGKSTVSAAKAVHAALSAPDQLILVVSPTRRQSWEMVKKAESFLGKLKIAPRRDKNHEISLRFPNGSRMIGLPCREDNIRGFSADLVLIDEASRVPDELYYAVRPMLAATGGSLWMLSTPNGQRGFFWKAWQCGESDWERVSVPAADCPRIQPKFLREERLALGEERYRQEYCCEFTNASGGVFDLDVVREAVNFLLPPLDIPFREGSLA